MGATRGGDADPINKREEANIIDQDGWETVKKPRPNIYARGKGPSGFQKGHCEVHHKELSIKWHFVQEICAADQMSRHSARRSCREKGPSG